MWTNVWFISYKLTYVLLAYPMLHRGSNFSWKLPLKGHCLSKKTFPKIPFLNNFAPLTSKLHPFLRVLRYLWHTCNHFFYKIYLLCGWPSLSVKCLNVWQILKNRQQADYTFCDQFIIDSWQMATLKKYWVRNPVK